MLLAPPQLSSPPFSSPPAYLNRGAPPPSRRVAAHVAGRTGRGGRRPGEAARRGGPEWRHGEAARRGGPKRRAGVATRCAHREAGRASGGRRSRHGRRMPRLVPRLGHTRMASPSTRGWPAYVDRLVISSPASPHVYPASPHVYPAYLVSPAQRATHTHVTAWCTAPAHLQGRV